jgi:ABC-type antimicrobial peptide transport system permease subunit
MTLLVETAGAPAAVLPEVRERVRALDPNLPILDTRTAAEHVRQSLLDSRNGATLAGAFGIVALLLAAVGIYGVIAYSVNGRTREIGIRMALGAERVDVLWMVAGEGFRRIALGLAIGAAASVGAGQILRKFLYGVSPADPATWAGVVLVLAVVALVATLAPARRAARVEPLVALRHD